MNIIPREDTQPRQQPLLSSLTGSRICHDLISPIGAITNGLELLGLSGSTTGPELALIDESVAQATARIKFFRLAFGVADASLQSVEDIAEILRGFDTGGRFKIQFEAQGAVARSKVRLLFLSVLCLERAMPFGGTIKLTRKDQTWEIRGQSERLQATDPTWQQLISGAEFENLSPATVQFGLLRESVAEMGADLHASLQDEVILIQI